MRRTFQYEEVVDLLNERLEGLFEAAKAYKERRVLDPQRDWRDGSEVAERYRRLLLVLKDILRASFAKGTRMEWNGRDGERCGEVEETYWYTYPEYKELVSDCRNAMDETLSDFGLQYNPETLEVKRK